MYNQLTMHKQMTDVKFLLWRTNTWNHLTVCKKKKQPQKTQARLKRLPKNVFTNHIYSIKVYLILRW